MSYPPGQFTTPPGYPPGQVPPLPQRPPQSHKVRNRVLGVVGALVLLGIGDAIGASGAKSGAAATPAPTVTVTVTAPAAPAKAAAKPKATAAAETTMSADGVYVVGIDIRRGIWHTSGATGGSSGDCYVALLSSTNTNDIIDNNNVTGPDTITVNGAVKAVDISGCNPWHRL